MTLTRRAYSNRTEAGLLCNCPGSSSWPIGGTRAATAATTPGGVIGGAGFTGDRSAHSWPAIHYTMPHLQPYIRPLLLLQTHCDSTGVASR